MNKKSGKAMDATWDPSWAPDYPVIMWDYNGGNNQLWFWDGNLLRNKYYYNKVLTISTEDYHKVDVCSMNWGKVYLSETVTGGNNQRWNFHYYGHEIVEIINNYNSLRLDVCNNNQNIKARVGGKLKNDGDEQFWKFIYIEPITTTMTKPTSHSCMYYLST